MIHKLQHLGHQHPSVFEGDEDTLDELDDEDDEDELVRDSFSLNKIIVAVTAPGKVRVLGGWTVLEIQ